MQRCVGGQLRVPKGKLSACVGESTPKVTLRNIEEIATSGTTLIQMRVRRRRGRRELHATNAVDGCAKTIWQDIHENRAPGSEAGPYRGRKAYQGSRFKDYDIVSNVFVGNQSLKIKVGYDVGSSPKLFLVFLAPSRSSSAVLLVA